MFLIYRNTCVIIGKMYRCTIMDSMLLYVVAIVMYASHVGPYHVYVIRQRLLTDTTRYTVNPTYICLHIKIKFFLFL